MQRMITICLPLSLETCLTYPSCGYTSRHNHLWVESEAMIDASWQSYEVSLNQLDTNPLIPGVPHIKVATTWINEPHLLIGMQMLLEEIFDLQ